MSVGCLLRRQEAEEIPEHEDLGNFQTVSIAKNEKVCSGKNSKGVGRRSLLQRDCRCVTHEYSQPS